MNKFSNSINNNDQDFSFPVMSSLSSCSSSSLWRISSRVYHHHLDEEEQQQHRQQQQQQQQDEDDDDGYMEVRSMCELEQGGSPNKRSSLEIYECSSCQGEELQIIMQEERMDFLWEDFNEEDKLKDVANHKAATTNHREIGYLQRSKTRIRMSRKSSPSISKVMMMGKLFKGLLSFRKTRF